MLKHRVELSHKVTVLYNWATNPDRDTISKLTEKQAKEINIMVNSIWKVIDRRNKA